jgi:succinoglycan biosynthesis protein ExoU
MAAPEARAQIVDVVIAAWNRADTIERAIRSALAEPEVGKVIVVDDASADDTAARAERIGVETNRVIVSRLPSNAGPSAARNKALELSSAPWIAILDGDDFFLPGRIGKLLHGADDLDFVADDVLQIEEALVGKAEPAPALGKALSGPSQLDFRSFVLGNISRRGALRRELGFLKPLMRRSFLDLHGLRYDRTLRLGEDYAFYARALALGARFLMTPARGYVSVVRSNSLSGRHTKEDLERLRDVDLKLSAMTNLSDADRRALRRHYRSIDAKVQWLGMIEAFKSRNPAHFLPPLTRSLEVSLAIAGKLFEEMAKRSAKRLGREML